MQQTFPLKLKLKILFTSSISSFAILVLFYKYYPKFAEFGKIENIKIIKEIVKISVFCRIVKTVPNLAVFMSSFTIVAIAIDRYYVICRPTRSQVYFLMSFFSKLKSCYRLSNVVTHILIA